MEVRILGPVEVLDGPSGGTLAIEGAKTRAALAALALELGRVLSVHDLVDALWGDDPPPTAVKTAQSHCSRLRGMLGSDAIRASANGYELTVPPASVDASRLAELVGASRDALHDGRPERARTLAEEAIELWRGDPLGDLADGDFRRAHADRLEELRIQALECQIDAAIAADDPAPVIADLDALVVRYPLREPLWGRLMLALYRSGRPADALRTYQRLRTRLGEDLGVEPSAELQRLESQIIRQDPALEPRPPPPPDNLPAALTSFVDREQDTERLSQTLGGHRLVTLHGPGGVGKTRLALETARALRAGFADGTWWIDLAPVEEGDAVIQRIGLTLGVRPAPGQTLASAVVSHVRHRELLLVVDNCEHLVEAVAPLLEEVLAAGSEVRALVTSRVPLGTEGEQLVPVAPLEVPPVGTPSGRLRNYASFALFEERARLRDPEPLDEGNTGAVASICRHLDGLPLAIELAAARCSNRHPAMILAELGEMLDSFEGATDERHPSMTATLDWGYELLSDDARRLFDHASLIPGSFDAATAQAVAAMDSGRSERLPGALDELVEASMLVAVRAPGAPRYRMLETLRAYGSAHLDAAERHRSMARLTGHCRTVVRRLMPMLGSSREEEALDRVDLDEPAMRTAVEWSAANETSEATLEFAGVMGHYWYLRVGDMAWTADVLERMLQQSGHAPPELRAWALLRLCYATFLAGNATRALDANAEALSLLEGIDEPALRAELESLRAHTILLTEADLDRATPLYESALDTATDAGLPLQRARTLTQYAQALAMADLAGPRVDAMLDEALHLFTEAGDSTGLAHMWMARNLACYATGDDVAAADAAHELVRVAAAARAGLYEQIGLVASGVMYLHAGALEAAESHLVRAVGMAFETGNQLQLGVALLACSALAAKSGEPERALRLWGAATQLAPPYPVHARRYAEFLDPARAALGDQVETELEAGRQLSVDAAVALAYGE